MIIFENFPTDSDKETTILQIVHNLIQPSAGSIFQLSDHRI